MIEIWRARKHVLALLAHSIRNRIQKYPYPLAFSNDSVFIKEQCEARQKLLVLSLTPFSYGNGSVLMA